MRNRILRVNAERVRKGFAMLRFLMERIAGFRTAYRRWEDYKAGGKGVDNYPPNAGFMKEFAFQEVFFEAPLAAGL